MNTHDSITFGKYLVSIAISRQKPLNMTKLQKLIFIIYGFFLTEQQHHIINEYPQAWPYGPVFPKIHKGVDYTNVVDLNSSSFDKIKGDPGLTDLVEKVVETYTKYTATQLSNWSHMEGSPWHRTTKMAGFKWSTEIPDNYIIEYFSTKSL